MVSAEERQSNTVAGCTLVYARNGHVRRSPHLSAYPHQTLSLRVVIDELFNRKYSLNSIIHSTAAIFIFPSLGKLMH